MYLEIALKILVSVLILLVIFCIPILLQMWRISKDITVILKTLNQSFPAILKNLEEITTSVNSSTAVINRKIQNFNNASTRSHALVDNIINNIKYLAPIALKLPIFRIIGNVVAIAKGVRVFSDVLFNKEKVNKEEV
jgi:glucosamine 6-phosphate synthetase-like amidotransferase/phosphosugar isomerase protein